MDILKRFTNNIKFCFDSDSAGLLALRRAGELALQKGFRLKIVVLKNAKDPDELIKKSPKLWEKAAAEAVWFLDYYINLAEEKFKQDAVAQKHYLSTEVVPFLGFITDALEQDHYINLLVKKYEISEKVIRGQIKAKNSGLNYLEKPKLAEKSLIKPESLEKEILGGMLFDENYLKKALEELEIQDFENPEIKILLKDVLELKDSSKLNRNSTLAKECVFMVESILEDDNGEKELLAGQLEKSFAIFKLNAIKRRQTLLGLEIKQAEKTNNKQQLAVLSERFARAAALRMKYEKLV